jgi:HlyD family secretion protein
VSIYPNDAPAVAGDLARLRINRNQAPRRRWVAWLILAVLAIAGAVAYPYGREYLAERRAPEVEVTRVVQVAAGADGDSALPVLVATGYVVARRSSDVGVKAGGRIATLAFEEGTQVKAGQIIATIEHADLDAQTAAARASVAEAETQLAQVAATRDEDARTEDRLRALANERVVSQAELTAAQSTAKVSAARVKSVEAAIASARARVKVAEEALENTNIRAPFDGVVIKKRAEVGETVSPFGVAGQAAREGGAIATIADIRELEVQTEVNESNVAKLTRAMPAVVTVQAYADRKYRGRLREIFPSADRAKSIVEVRVSILDADAGVKPEMSASVTFQEPQTAAKKTSGAPAAAPAILVAKRAVVGGDADNAFAWVVTNNIVKRRPIVRGPDRIDQVEVRSGLAPGDAVVLTPPAGLADGMRVRVKAN